MSAALALGLLTAGTAWSQDRVESDGPLGKLHAEQGVACAKCHGKAAKAVPVPQEKCLACHEGDSRALAARTSKVRPVNPHESRHYGTEAECGLCHRQHEPSVNFCADCHPRFDFKVK